ncbi:MAG: long-chain fatty acid--CoA ligase [Bacteroidales bacterium]|jgi:long-chain acyl-CoA synthetase|nr:long-chain fatty acid--CoA ligase [Bacteroidales bacterium]
MEVTRLFDIPARYAQLCPGKTDALAGREDKGGWRTYSTEEYVNNSNYISYGLMKLGVKKGDKIASITTNRPEWNFLDMGVQQLGAIHIPIYPTISDKDYEYILEHAEVSYVFVAGEDLLRRIGHIVEKRPSIKGIYTFKHISKVPHLNELIELGKNNQKPEALQTIKDSIRPNDMVTIIYTSGTTGVPKGVMLSHDNIMSNVIGVRDIPPYGPEHRALSFLPICHIYERMLNYTFLYKGLSMYYLANMGFISDSLKEINPHVFSTVPRLLEKVYDKIIAKGRALSSIKKSIFFWANNVGLKYEFDKEKKNPIYGLELKLARKLVLNKWKEALGKNLDIVVSGGAALQPRLARVFWAVGIRVIEGYGLTETSPVIAVENFEPDGLKFGTVGPPLKNVTVKIAEDGEILVKGPGVMLGYYKDPEMTAEVIDEEGWFHTGDIGKIEPEGQLRITDRKKMIFKTSFGKYIAPQMIENKFKESSFIDQIMVIGENQKFAGALIVPDFAHLKSWCQIKGIPYTTNAEMIAIPRIRKRFEKEVKHYNESFGDWERIIKFELIDHDWTVEGGHLSATLKVRRGHLTEVYADLISKIFGGNDSKA